MNLNGGKFGKENCRKADEGNRKKVGRSKERRKVAVSVSYRNKKCTEHFSFEIR
jgi:hypothetical protein